MNKKKTTGLANLSNLVYSTNPDAMQQEEEIIETLEPSKQELKVYHDSKRRAGKTVTVVEGFIGTEDDLNDLGKLLKTKCGVGGSAKDNVIIIQGAFKEKIAQWLSEWKYKVKLR